MTIWDDLRAEFPREAISWRAQTLTKTGDKALALAYIDARDVMNRLDDVMGPENWKDRYEFSGGTAICYLAIRHNEEWIEKADGAGSTDVEAEKGQISDALKRSAVRWGVGRYLYDLPTVWAPCESYEKNGKFYWSKWKGDPWDSVRGSPPANPTEKPKEGGSTYGAHITALTLAKTMDELTTAFEAAWKSTTNADDRADFKAGYDAKKEALS